MGYLGRRIGKSQDQGDSNPNGADGAVGGGILNLFENGYFERQGDIYNAPGAAPTGITASGGVVSDYVAGTNIYRAHVFTSSGTFAVTEIGSYGNTVDYLVVAGGGGGGQEGGGGGAGGVRSSHPDVPSPNQGSALTVAVNTYTVTIGAGGIGAHFQMPNGTPAECNGSPSHFGSGSSIPIQTSGGGAGGSKRNENTGPEIPIPYRGGRAGGSGGGAARDADNQGGGAANTPPHTKQIGNIGGNSPGSGSNSAGGGGGAGAQGQNQRHPDSGGHGGQGMRIRIAGNPVNPSPIGYPGPGSGADATGYFAAGGGGGGNSGPGGTGGSYDGSSLIPGGPYGGAGNGTWQGDPNTYGSAPSGSQGSGSGGGGGGFNPGAQRGGQGGSGIIVLRYQIGQVNTGSAKATGGSISYYNDKTIHVFNHSGTFTAPSPLNPTPLAVTYVVVAGGGSGAGPGGGGGAGQYITGPTTVTAGSSVSVQVGGGGAAPGNSFGIGQDGTPSYFGTPITAGGGGGGGNYNTDGRNGLPGTTGTGSGGGVGRDAPGRSAGGGTSPGANPGGPWNAGGGGGGSGGSGGGGAGAAGSASVGSGARVPGGYGVQLHPDLRDPTAGYGDPGTYGGGTAPTPGGFWFAGGGGAGPHPPGATPSTPGGGYGGTGGGGTGLMAGNRTVAMPDSTNAAANTGGGGGGSGGTGGEGPSGGRGGSGIVIVYYPT